MTSTARKAGYVTTHYHAITNVSGYLPMADDLPAYETFGQACDALRDEISIEIDNEEFPSRRRELEAVQSELDALSSVLLSPAENSFLAYTSTHADSDHDIPTAWQVVPCEESECEVPAE